MVGSETDERRRTIQALAIGFLVGNVIRIFLGNRVYAPLAVRGMDNPVRVWRNGVLIQPMCIAKTTELYFTAQESAMPCGKTLFVLPNFWMWHPSGNLDARVCDVHASIGANGRHYLADRIKESKESVQQRCAAMRKELGR